MTIDDLHRVVVHGFKRVDERFAAHDQQFSSIAERFERVDKQFERIDERFEQMERRIREEGETTRRHFDVMVESIEAAVRIVAAGHGHLQNVADIHEARLQAIEKRL